MRRVSFGYHLVCTRASHTLVHKLAKELTKEGMSLVTSL